MSPTRLTQDAKPTPGGYRYRIYKRGGLWLVRKRRHTNASVVHGPFDNIDGAWFWIGEDVDRRKRYEAAQAEKKRNAL
jgi:hypothetical protein